METQLADVDALRGVSDQQLVHHSFEVNGEERKRFAMRCRQASVDLFYQLVSTLRCGLDIAGPTHKRQLSHCHTIQNHTSKPKNTSLQVLR